jgi:hypothetical protein
MAVVVDEARERAVLGGVDAAAVLEDDHVPRDPSREALLLGKALSEVLDDELACDGGSRESSSVKSKAAFCNRAPHRFRGPRGRGGRGRRSR